MKQAELNAVIRTALRHARIGVAPGGPVEIDIQGENVRVKVYPPDSTRTDSSPHRDPLEGRLDAVDQKLKAKAVAREATARS